MKTLVQITAKCYENKSWYDKPEAPTWKPKSFDLFNLYVENADDFFYNEEKCLEAVKRLLEDESGMIYKYEYAAHKVVFNEPIELNSAKFELLLLEEYFPELKK